MNLEKLLDVSINLAERHISGQKPSHDRYIKMIQRSLIINRMIAREIMLDYCAIDTELRKCKRTKRKLIEAMFAQKVMFPPLEAKTKLLEGALSEQRKILASWGESLMGNLDLWQECGATLKDLCNLCNRRYEDVLTEIKTEHINEPFSDLMFVYNLDYNHKGDWIDYEKDAPLTHAISEYMRDIILHTDHGGESAHSALEACFPDLMDSAIHQSTDYDGNPVWRDKDGEIVSGL